MSRRPHLLIIAAAIVSFILGIWGYMVVVPPIGVRSFGLLDSMYRSFQLFVLNREDPAGVPWQIDVARFLAPISTLGGLSFLLHRIHTRARLYWAKRREHVIVCGLGRKGVVNIHAIRSKKSVVAIERFEDNEAAGSLEALRIPVVRGDARERPVLVEAGINTATEIIVACGDDDTDVRVVRQAVACIAEADARSDLVLPSESRRVVKLVPHLDDLEPRGLLRNHVDEVNGRLKSTRLLLIDYCHQSRAARSLFEKHPLDRRRISKYSADVPHLILIGFGRMGESVFQQALQVAHYPNGSTLRVDVFDRRIDELWLNFSGRFPNFVDERLAPPAEIRLHGGDLLDPRRLARISEIIRGSDVQPMIVIAFDNETEAARVVSHLPDIVAAKSIPVCVRIEQEGGLAEMMQESARSSRLGSREKVAVHVFGHVEATADYDDERESVAKALHAKYLELQGSRSGRPLKPSEQPWGELDEELRESNRRAADFIPVLLRSFGCRVATFDEAKAASLEIITVLDPEDEAAAAVAEHGRWYAERYLAGWTFGTSEESSASAADLGQRVSPSMVPWKALPEEAQKRAGWPVSYVVGTLASIGKCIVRDELPPRSERG